MSGNPNPNASGIVAIRFTGFLCAMLVFSSSVYAQTGRIAGEVTVAGTTETLPGVNVIIEGLQTGAASNPDGYYSIINVPPGTYTIRASAVGFATVVVEDVRVNIDQTANVDIAMREQEFVGDEVVLIAERPVVERDVSSSRANISSEQIERLPVSNIESVIGLQAGIQGLTVRGQHQRYMQFTVNGMSMRDERDNTPYTAISLTSIAEVQVQSGGFNAEHGNVQSGLVNIVTREGNRDRYNADVIYRLRPPGQRNFGPAPNDPNSFFMRPFLDDEVAWTGTDNGAWDEYQRRSYPDFKGWNAVAEENMDPSSAYYGLSPAAAQQLFLWQHRKDFGITEPDYDLDIAFGGPVPFISNYFGNLRFWASHRRSQRMYFVPLATDRYDDHSTHIKLTSDLRQGSGMKLNIETLFGTQSGTNTNNLGEPGMFTSGAGIASAVDRHSFARSIVFSDSYFAPTKVDRFMIGSKFTHSMSSDAFYNIQLSHFRSQYDTNPGRSRSLEPVREFGNQYWANEAPFGFYQQSAEGIGSGMRMGVGMSNSRDSSQVNYTTASFDYTNQVNSIIQVKSGAEFVHTQSRVNYASVDEFLRSGRTASRWNRDPLRGGAYAQSRLEFEGLIANIGLRLDYSYANTQWFDFDPFDPALGAGNFDSLGELLEMTDVDHQLFLSPRLGVSFPITVNSKLYFNYGHFRSMPTPENLYMVREETFDQRVSRIANPNMPLPQTVAYELGYEHNIFENYLVRLAGYYQDITNNPELVTYTSSNEQVRYTISQPNRYRDHRGFELTLERRGGRFFRGFINYTYMVTSTGRFDFEQQFQNPAEQRRHERETVANDQFRPVARPFARFNLEFFTPAGFGPEWGSVRFLERWNFSLISSWQAGRYFSDGITGPAPPDVINNLQWRDFYNVDLRISKEFEVSDNRVQMFLDMNNVFNTKRMSQFANYGFEDGNDYRRYIRSLHHPQKILDEAGAPGVPGKDKPGDFRDFGVEFVPIEATGNLDAIEQPNERALYYNINTGEFFQWRGDDFVSADGGFVQQVLDDKAYIEMPNHDAFTFFNPRNIFWGIRIRF